MELSAVSNGGLTIVGEGALMLADRLQVPLDQLVMSFIGGILLLAVFLIALGQHHPLKPEHIKNIKESKKALGSIRRITNNQKRMEIMRDMHPNVFEELILTALKSPFRKVRRNTRYTGDGGIDGQARINGQWHFIQAKRYTNHISASHVDEFIRLCKSEGKPGLFIHTGVTGEKSRELISQSSDCHMISGQALCTMIAGEVSVEHLINQSVAS